MGVKPSLWMPLYSIACEFKVKPKHVCECATLFADTIETWGFLNYGCRMTLIEPQPEPFKTLVKEYGHLDTVRFFNVAIGWAHGTSLLMRDNGPNGSAYIAGINAPRVQHRRDPNFTSGIEVPRVPWEVVDDGTIDLLHLDMEGMEWTVLQQLISKPKMISVEWTAPDYVQPNAKEIEQWMDEGGYRQVGQVRVDRIYLRP